MSRGQQPQDAGDAARRPGALERFIGLLIEKCGSVAAVLAPCRARAVFRAQAAYAEKLRKHEKQGLGGIRFAQ